MMVDIVEQAKQSPKNATPIGWDDTIVRYPGVNTCMTLTSVAKEGPLIGLHLGLCMDDLGPNEKMDAMLDAAHLDLYLWAFEQRLFLKQKGKRAFHLAGAIRVWQPSNGPLWSHLQQKVNVLANKAKGTVEEHQFDDDASMTVDIYVDAQGVRFTTPGTDTAVATV